MSDRVDGWWPDPWNMQDGITKERKVTNGEWTSQTRKVAQPRASYPPRPEVTSDIPPEEQARRRKAEKKKKQQGNTVPANGRKKERRKNEDKMLAPKGGAQLPLTDDTLNKVEESIDNFGKGKGEQKPQGKTQAQKPKVKVPASAKKFAQKTTQKQTAKKPQNIGFDFSVPDNVKNKNTTTPAKQGQKKKQTRSLFDETGFTTEKKKTQTPKKETQKPEPSKKEAQKPQPVQHPEGKKNSQVGDAITFDEKTGRPVTPETQPPVEKVDTDQFQAITENKPNKEEKGKEEEKAGSKDLKNALTGKLSNPLTPEVKAHLEAVKTSPLTKWVTVSVASFALVLMAWSTNTTNTKPVGFCEKYQTVISKQENPNEISEQMQEIMASDYSSGKLTRQEAEALSSAMDAKTPEPILTHCKKQQESATTNTNLPTTPPSNPSAETPEGNQAPPAEEVAPPPPPPPAPAEEVTPPPPPPAQ